jgi:hypothetical protein
VLTTREKTGASRSLLFPTKQLRSLSSNFIQPNRVGATLILGSNSGSLFVKLLLAKRGLTNWLCWLRGKKGDGRCLPKLLWFSLPHWKESYGQQDNDHNDGDS